MSQLNCVSECASTKQIDFANYSENFLGYQDLNPRPCNLKVTIKPPLQGCNFKPHFLILWYDNLKQNA